MSLKNAILGLLNYSPMTGYCIKSNIDGPMAGFWSVSYGSLYPALQKMTTEGLIGIEELNDSRKQKLYHITTRGKEELKSWFSQKTSPTLAKNEYLLKTFLSIDLCPRDRIQILREYVQSKINNLQQLQEFSNQRDRLILHRGNEILLNYSSRALKSEINILKEIIEEEGEKLD